MWKHQKKASGLSELMFLLFILQKYATSLFVMYQSTLCSSVCLRQNPFMPWNTSPFTSHPTHPASVASCNSCEVDREGREEKMKVSACSSQCVHCVSICLLGSICQTGTPKETVGVCALSMIWLINSTLIRFLDEATKRSCILFHVWQIEDFSVAFGCRVISHQVSPPLAISCYFSIITVVHSTRGC